MGSRFRVNAVALGALALCGLGALGAAEIPRKSAEFAVTLPDGKEALVSQFRGKVLCLVFVLSS